MNEQDKELLFIDLLGRIPYNLKCEYKDELYEVIGYVHGRVVLVKPFMSSTISPLIEEVKPYLFPMSSMTEKQNNLWRDVGVDDLFRCIDVDYPKTGEFLALAHSKSVEWLDKNHFDYRGLIEKGLAIDATNLNIY